MKRIASWLFIAVMCISLAACGGTKEEKSDTVGGKTAALFLDELKANGEISNQELADAILEKSQFEFAAVSMEVEPGLLTGFGNTEITGFQDGVMFGPVIGTIPFIGYVFTVEDGTNVDDFVALLKDNAERRWNICTDAEEMTAEQSGSRVLFVMGPRSFEEGETE